MRIIAIAVALLLAGCTGMPASSPDYAINQLNRHYDGRPVRDFFLIYGNPVSKKQTEESGGALYRWISLEPQESIPTPVYHSYHTPNGNFAVPDSTTTISPQPQYCQIGIATDRRDIIQNIFIVYDSPGKWSNSLCGEIFRQ